ncbi:MAG: hypothetical protein CMG46_03160 [Candidatus Marinimicrobia bacterium]|nr:hypothetical protein [Candidatus Neomarinimicrobiota bacterium]
MKIYQSFLAVASRFARRIRAVTSSVLLKGRKMDLSKTELKILELISMEGFHKNLIQKEFKILTQKHGLNITPSNFYSSVPLVDDLETHYKKNINKQIYNHPSVFDEQFIKKYLSNLSQYQAEFTPPDNPIGTDGQYFSNNEMFSHSDAMAYYCFVRHLKPKTIVEIGSGYSTSVAREALIKNGTDNTIISNEPHPSKFLLAVSGVEIFKRKAQEISAKEIDESLDEGDILFIDSTHTVKEGSDVIHIISNILPYISKKIYVHFHDIFLPFVFPKYWVEEHRYWEEQYLLYAFLLDNPRAKVLFGSSYNAANFQQQMDQFTVSEVIHGGSLWFQYN